MPARIDHTGKRFGKLVVLKRMPQQKYEKAKYLCQCDCGNQIVVNSSNLSTGHAKSCGCIVKKHGLSHKERLYNIWVGMKQRCRDINSPDYYRYGGRGICVCKEWDNDYLSFRKWALQNGYDDTLSIDRVDSNGNYEPGNCRWETFVIQNNNKSGNRIVNYGGEELTLAEFARKCNIPYRIVNQRIQRGWDIRRIVSTPVKEVRINAT